MYLTTARPFASFWLPENEVNCTGEKKNRVQIVKKEKKKRD
jgi:hypothetical protein